MFEKEAEEFADCKKSFWRQGRTCIDSVIQAFQKGAEFGYKKGLSDQLVHKQYQLNQLRKANEWNYVKDGLPKKDGFYLVAFHNIGCDAVDVGQFLRGEWWHSDEEIKIFINKNIYAWKELPNPPKEIEQI